MSGFIPQQNSDTSATGGLLVAATGPISKTRFEDTISSIISGVTGIPRNLVRPRWQPTPPAQPSFDTNWIAFGVTRRSRDANPVIRHFGGLEDGYDELQRQILIDTVVSFYGPDSIDLSELLRDSFRIEQNFYPLLAIDVALNDLEDSVKTAELINNQWVDRTDITIRFVQREVRTYPIRSLVAAEADIQSDSFTTNTDHATSSFVFLPSAVVYSGVMGNLAVAQTGGISVSSTTGLLFKEIDSTLSGISMGITPGSLNMNNSFQLSDGSPLQLSDGSILTT